MGGREEKSEKARSRSRRRRSRSRGRRREQVHDNGYGTMDFGAFGATASGAQHPAAALASTFGGAGSCYFGGYGGGFPPQRPPAPLYGAVSPGIMGASGFPPPRASMPPPSAVAAQPPPGFSGSSFDDSAARNYRSFGGRDDRDRPQWIPGRGRNPDLEAETRTGAGLGSAWSEHDDRRGAEPAINAQSRRGSSPGAGGSWKHDMYDEVVVGGKPPPEHHRRRRGR